MNDSSLLKIMYVPTFYIWNTLIQSLIPFFWYRVVFFRCGGVVIENILYTNIPPRERKQVGVKTLHFLPYFQHGTVDVSVCHFKL